MKLELKDGRAATLQSVRGEFVEVRSEASSPPGSTLELRSPDGPSPFLMKVRSCRREEAGGRFMIEGRWVNLSRRQRQILVDAGLFMP